MKYTVLIKRETYATFEIDVDERDDESVIARGFRARDMGYNHMVSGHIRDIDLTIDTNRTGGWRIVDATKTTEDTP